MREHWFYEWWKENCGVIANYTFMGWFVAMILTVIFVHTLWVAVLYGIYTAILLAVLTAVWDTD